MLFKYNLLLSENDFNDLLNSLKFNQSNFDKETQKESIKLVKYFVDESKFVKQNDIEMATICLTDLQMQELVLQLVTTNSYFFNREKLNWNYFKQVKSLKN